jgi:MFS family permease
MRSVPAKIIAALFLAEMTVTFEASMVYAALPTLIREFGDPLNVGWLVTIHMLIAAASAPVIGRLGDIKGRKRLVVVLLALALVGSVISAVSTNFGVVLFGRGLQGLSAVVLPLSIGIVRESLPEDKVPMGIGVLTTALGAGPRLAWSQEGSSSATSTGTRSSGQVPCCWRFPSLRSQPSSRIARARPPSGRSIGSKGCCPSRRSGCCCSPSE